MAEVTKLTGNKILNLKPGQQISDGRGGRGLHVRKSPSPKAPARFYQRIRIKGKITNLSLGVFTPDGGSRVEGGLTLRGARNLAARNYILARDGGDPRTEKPKQPHLKGLRRLEDVAREFLEIRKKSAGWSDSTKKQWKRSVDRISRRIGKVPVAKVGPADVSKALQPEWPRPMAKQDRFRLRQILQHAINNGLRSTNPVDAVQLAGRHVPQKMAYVPVRRAPEVYRKVRTVSGVRAASRLCLEFVALTACRGHEARQARWHEVDMAEAVWSIPPEHLKQTTGDALRVPLSRRALAVLREAGDTYGRNPQAFIFPNRVNRGAMVRDTGNRLMCRIGETARCHGWRSTFRTWAGEAGVRWEWAETALGHAMPGISGRYERGDFLEHRREVMERWAAYLTEKPAPTVEADSLTLTAREVALIKALRVGG